MASKNEANVSTPEVQWLSVVGRSLAFLCLHQAELDDATIGEKGRFLKALGLNRRDIAALLDTTEETVRVQMSDARKVGGSKGGKKAKSTKKQ